MPEIGEIKRGLELGYKSNALHALTPCSICGKPRWVVLSKGKPVNTCCYDCKSQSPAAKHKVSQTLLAQSVRPPATQRTEGEAPQIGDIQYGHALGFASNNPYTRQACVECGTEAWLPLIKGKYSTHCRSCTGKSPERLARFVTTLINNGACGDYPPPRGTINAPELGDIRIGQELGRKNWAKYMWYGCNQCGIPRWATYREGKVVWPLCRKCAARDPKRCQAISVSQLAISGLPPLSPIGDPLNPQIGDLQRAIVLGLGTGWRIRQACKDCGRVRWVRVCKGQPDTIRCVSCARKNPSRIAQAISTRLATKASHQIYGQRRKAGAYYAIRLSPDDPYYTMCNSHGYVLEHRYVMAQHLGRCLLPNPYEVVHHKFGDKRDNRIEMLELTQSGKHIKDHNKGYSDGYDKGYSDGQSTRIKELEEENTLLTFLLERSNL
jgi:hypothetical protein